MSPRRRIQTDAPETEGSRRMSRRRRIQTDVPETEGPDGCLVDGGSRRMSPRRRIQTGIPFIRLAHVSFRINDILYLFKLPCE